MDSEQTQNSRTTTHLVRDMIIIIMIALVAALFIWKYFEYKILKIKSLNVELHIQPPVLYSDRQMDSHIISTHLINT
jgi:hypothetical protein